MFIYFFLAALTLSESVALLSEDEVSLDVLLLLYNRKNIDALSVYMLFFHKRIEEEENIYGCLWLEMWLQIS